MFIVNGVSGASLHCINSGAATDPACGSGNFLTETYLSIRRLENRVIRMLYDMEKGQVSGQISFADETTNNPIEVSISQFYGIEINDFAVTVAKTALWIAESQMMKETEDVVHMNLDFLPLKTNAHIVEGNALRIDWKDVVQPSELDYIMGNPPFVGARLMNEEQKNDVKHIFMGWKNLGNLDYVSCWYKKAADYITNYDICVALVSTNSVSQGDAVPILWKELFKADVHIDFAYRTFIWDSEASAKAHVHCVIIGFSKRKYVNKPRIFDGENTMVVNHINAYLIDSPDIFIENRSKPLSDVPLMGIGNQPIDDGNFLFETEEDMQNFIRKEPEAKKFFHPWYGSREFIAQKPRYCLYLGDCTPAELKSMPNCMKRIQAVKGSYRKR
ncbi:DNA methyltransferase [Claveliimonas bilis]|uniref:DNA methyltransferase n=1 Tax=Claveliimonas bilis TaxID=3028070 RepID=UPI00292DC23E|nr:DNA methyltransferase [Claveliimonas bilis]